MRLSKDEIASMSWDERLLLIAQLENSLKDREIPP